MKPREKLSPLEIVQAVIGIVLWCAWTFVWLVLPIYLVVTSP